MTGGATGEPCGEDDLRFVSKFISDNPDIATVEVVVTDLHGIQRGKWIPISHLPDLFRNGFKIAADIVSPDVWGRDVPTIIRDTGEGDCPAHGIPGTLRRLAWTSRPTAQVRLGLRMEDGTAEPRDPRGVLESVLARYDELDLRPVIAPEMEFCLYRLNDEPYSPSPLPEVAGHGLNDLAALHEHREFIEEISLACDMSGIEMEGFLKELGPHQFEAVMSHQADAMAIADNAAFLKYAVRQIARKHDKAATFMAKPNMNQPGNGMHLHVSMLKGNGDNIFDDGGERGTEALKFAVGGLLETMADFFLIFAPNLNSFRRFGSGSHASLAPTWGYENRQSAVRVPGGLPKARRLEHRVSGADTNPYLVIAAVLAGILHGLENEIMPPPELIPGTDRPAGTLPRNWYEAVDVFEASSLVQQHFPGEFCSALVKAKRFEIETFDADITPLERETYFATI